MGKLFYGGSTALDIEDRELAHLAAVIVAKLRRDEKFQLTWAQESEPGTTTVWMHPAIPLRFLYSTSRPVQLSRAWVEALSVAASGSGTLQRIPEPQDEPVRASR
ncbi:MAG TPA: hypothetical protein VIL55_12150 [Naasia sp.]|jgi:hypothetical protein